MPGPILFQPAPRTQHTPVTHFSPGATSRANTPQLTLQRKPADAFDTGPRDVKGKPQIDGQGGLQYLELRTMIMDNPHLGETQRKNLLARLDTEVKSGGGPLTKTLTTMKNQNLDARTTAGLLTPAGSSDPAMMDGELKPGMLASAKAGVASSDYRWSDLVLGLFNRSAPPNQQSPGASAPPNQSSANPSAPRHQRSVDPRHQRSVDPRHQRSADPYPRTEAGAAKDRGLQPLPSLPKPKK